MKFGLKQGMDKQAIVAEMWGRTSGETRGQVLQVLMPREERKVGAKIKQMTIDGFAEWFLLRKDWALGRWLYVLKENGEYALIKEDKAHARIYKTPSKLGAHVNSSDDYYLAGLSDDEEKYFIHKLETTETRNMAKLVSNSGASLREFVDFIDRKDEKFETRVQGDLLLQFVPVKVEKQVLMDGRPAVEAYQYYTLPNGVMQRCHFTLSDRMLELAIGRHRVHVCGKSTFLSWPSPNYRVFGGDCITIAHPEHRTAIVDIPDGQLAVIGVQRGPPQQREGD